MSQSSLPLRYTLRIFRIPRPRFLAMIEIRIRREILLRYSRLVERGLRDGLTKEDLTGMRERSRFFASPVCENSLLLRLRIRFELLRAACWVVCMRRNYAPQFRRILWEFEARRADHWNPSLHRASTHHREPEGDCSLHLFVIPSPYGFAWDSPRKLLFSLRNYLARSRNHKIGHAIVVLKRGKCVVAAAGMTGETNYSAFFKLLFLGRGLEVLFATYRGRLECSRFVLEDIRRHEKSGYIREQAFPLSEEKFMDCIAHLRHWCERGAYSRYGLTFPAGDFEGASCTSFAVNFLQVAGLLRDEHHEAWKRKIQLPANCFSSPGSPLGLFRLTGRLFSFGAAIPPAEPRRFFEFWDPDLMFSRNVELGSCPQGKLR
jgi:hypothetical protein